MDVIKFSQQVLQWYAQHGRKDLPWQHPRSGYRVWLSEIMLQQTQVTTVIPYFKRFIQAYPSIKKLANAELDSVLHLWTGLGYYARARNLHKAANIICANYAGRLPRTREVLQQLPGIGRSTAGAILSLAYDQPQAILDGNVKRVLARYHAIQGWPGQANVEQQLWQVAEQYVPAHAAANYTQAMMDLGAMICTRTQPKCMQCPLHKNCLAYQTQQVQKFPFKKPKVTKPFKQTYFLMLFDAVNSTVLLYQRPATGIWGGLWSFPEVASEQDIYHWYQAHASHQLQASQLTYLAPFRHSFTHFHLDIHPVMIYFDKKDYQPIEEHAVTWYDLQQTAAQGLSAPVKRLLQKLKSEHLQIGKSNASSQLCEV
jgi:A/G-specific adenine glycosylase